MSERFKCGDAECWCATMTALVVSPECKDKPPVDLQTHPFHRGWWRRVHTPPAEKKTS